MFVAILAALQMPWTAHLPQHGAAIDLLRPKFESGATSLASFAAYASARMPLGGSNLRVELPFARVATTSGGSSTSFGNPYIGLEVGGETGLIHEAGIRGPLASDDEFATQVGALSDITRLEAFLPSLATISLRSRYRFRDPGGTGFMFDAGGGPSVWVPTERGDAELVLHHHMMAGYWGSSAWFLVGFGGLTAISENEGSIADRTLHQAGASFGFTSGKARPALHVIVPLQTGFGSNVQIVLGLGVAITLQAM